jgi:hypothetical protein
LEAAAVKSQKKREVVRRKSKQKATKLDASDTASSHPQQQQQQQEPKNKTTNAIITHMKCYECQQLGHFGRNCPYRAAAAAAAAAKQQHEMAAAAAATAAYSSSLLLSNSLYPSLNSSQGIPQHPTTTATTTTIIPTLMPETSKSMIEPPTRMTTNFQLVYPSQRRIISASSPQYHQLQSTARPTATATATATYPHLSYFTESSSSSASINPNYNNNNCNRFGQLSLSAFPNGGGGSSSSSVNNPTHRPYGEGSLFNSRSPKRFSSKSHRHYSLSTNNNNNNNCKTDGQFNKWNRRDDHDDDGGGGGGGGGSGFDHTGGPGPGGPSDNNNNNRQQSNNYQNQNQNQNQNHYYSKHGADNNNNNYVVDQLPDEVDTSLSMLNDVFINDEEYFNQPSQQMNAGSGYCLRRTTNFNTNLDVINESKEQNQTTDPYDDDDDDVDDVDDDEINDTRDSGDFENETDDEKIESKIVLLNEEEEEAFEMEMQIESPPNDDELENAERRRGGKRVTLGNLYPQLNKKYNYNDIADLSNSSIPKSPEEPATAATTAAACAHPLIDFNNNNNNNSSSSNDKVKDWLCVDLITLNNDESQQTTDSDDDDDETNTQILDKEEEEETATDLPLLLLQMDTSCQLVDNNRHTLLLHNRSTRIISPTYDKMSQFGLHHHHHKIRSHSADSSRGATKPSNAKEAAAADDDEDNESFASCVEEHIRSCSTRSTRSTGKAAVLIEEEKKKKDDDKKDKGSKCAFDYSSTMTTIQPPAAAPFIDNGNNNTSTPNKPDDNNDDDDESDVYFCKSTTQKKRHLLNSKKEKLKQFTVSVFVDSFEDYSFNSSSSSSSSNALAGSDGNLTVIKATAAATATEDISILEFERNEALATLSSVSEKKILQATLNDDDDVFMFQSKANFSYAPDKATLVAKPPLGPSLVTTLTPPPPPPPPNDNVNLSVIQEASLELVSSSGSFRPSQFNLHDFGDKVTKPKSKSSSSLSDSFFSSQLVRESPSIRARKEQLIAAAAAAASSATTSNIRTNSTSSITTLTIIKSSPPPPPSPPTDGSGGAFVITDKNFEKFCYLSNDEIMAYTSSSQSSDLSVSSSSSSASSATSMPTVAAKKVTSSSSSHHHHQHQNHKINSKMLTDYLESSDEQQQQPTPISPKVVNNINSDSTSARSYELAAHNYEKKIKQLLRSHDDDDDDDDDDDVFLEQPPPPPPFPQQRRSRSMSSHESSDNNSPTTSNNERRFSSNSAANLKDKCTLNPNQNNNNNNNKTATTTTLEISSYTSDSLFNSHFAVTPMYSDGGNGGGVGGGLSTSNFNSLQLSSVSGNVSSVGGKVITSPTHLIIRSPLFQPNSPNAKKQLHHIMYSNNRFNSSSNSNWLVSHDLDSFNSLPQQQQQQQQQQFKSPTHNLYSPPPAAFFVKVNNNNNQLQSPSTISNNGTKIQSPLLPPPPPPPPPPPMPTRLENLVQKPLPPAPAAPHYHNSRSTLSSTTSSKSVNSTVGGSSSTSHLKLFDDSLPLNQKRSSSLIESLTARLNLTRLTQDTTTAAQTNKSRTTPHQAALLSGSGDVLTSVVGAGSLGSIFRNPLEMTTNKKPIVNRNKDQADSSPINDKKTIPVLSVKPPSSPTPRSPSPYHHHHHHHNKNKWIKADFSSLYGLDDDEVVVVEEEEEEEEQSFPLPPPCEFSDPLYANEKPKISVKSYQAPLPPPPPLPQSKPCNVTVGGLPAAPARVQYNFSQSHYSNTSSITTVIPNVNYKNEAHNSPPPPPPPSQAQPVMPLIHYKSCPNLVDLLPQKRDESSTTTTTSSSSSINDPSVNRIQPSFKLDHLLDINPKRLYANAKFRCRIHDIIDARGRFWLEVLYSIEDERKFAEIFKLFRLCAKISEAPGGGGGIFKSQRLAAIYKNEWHRAVVVETPTPPAASANNQQQVKVRFLDLGIVKTLDRASELRQIDQKFFNCPNKALYCSINLEDDDDDDDDDNDAQTPPLGLSKESRKFFTRLIYKKCLFAKVVDLSCSSSSNSICRIVLGFQTQRGIIDVYMHMLSKFDRKRYEIIKKNAAAAAAAALQSIQQTEKLTVTGNAELTPLIKSKPDTEPNVYYNEQPQQHSNPSNRPRS